MDDCLKAKKFGASLSKFEVTSRKTPRKHCKYRFRSVLAKESRAYPRDVVAGVATKRGPALLLAARRRVRRAAALTRLAPAPKVGGILLPPPMRGLLAAPVRLRRPYNAEIIPARINLRCYKSPLTIWLLIL